MSRRVVRAVLDQHVAELAILWNTRRGLAAAGHVALRHLGRYDRRIAAQQDGCVVAGAEGFRLLLERFVDPDAPTAFAAAVVALEARDPAGLERCLAVAGSVPASAAGVRSALGWVDRDRLAGVGRDLLVATSPAYRRFGLATCRLHGVDPGAPLLAGLNDPSPMVRAEALRTAGTIGRHALGPTLAARQDDDPDCQFWAAWSAVLLGDRMVALDTLTRLSLAPAPHRARAFRLALQAKSTSGGHAMLQALAKGPDHLRWLIQGSGIVGDPTYVPWLIGHMTAEQTARVAGEAFSLITGTDLAGLDLERRPPDDFESGPNDNPGDPNVDMDPDDGLPWPDPARAEKWWVANSTQFQAGTRYFMGGLVTREHCIDVLSNGYQRQRILAAHYLCLLEPGTPLFNTSAPAWRQERLLAAVPGSSGASQNG